MRLRVSVLLGMLLVLAGCDQWLRPEGDPRREANYMQGERWKIQRDPQRAISSFERALEVNPQNYYAHEQLYDLQFNLNDFAGAYYHLQRYMSLSKDTNYFHSQQLNLTGLKLAQQFADQIGRAQNQNDIDAWKQRYFDASNQVQTLSQRLALTTASLAAAQNRSASTPPPVPYTAPVRATPEPQPVVVTPSPTTPRGSAARPDSTSGNLATTVRHAGPTGSGGAITPVGNPTTPTGTRKHVVKSGDIPATIAKRYGITLKDLMAANPNLDPKKLKVGMELTIPNK